MALALPEFPWLPIVPSCHCDLLHLGRRMTVACIEFTALAQANIGFVPAVTHWKMALDGRQLMALRDANCGMPAYIE